MSDNLPDDCQGSGKHLPWNQEEELHECWSCEHLIEDTENHNLINRGTSIEPAYLCDCCADDLKDVLTIEFLD